MKTILTYGTFDLFHVGHVRLLKRLRDMGDQLIVGVSTDEFNAQKGKRCLISYEHRAEIIASSRYVDAVIPEQNWEQKRQDIIDNKIDVFAMGGDWEGKFDDLADTCEVVYLPRTESVSTTEIKQLLTAFDSKKIAQLQDALELLQEVAHELG